jgi:transcriptional regulator with XRE-family HTH domain
MAKRNFGDLLKSKRRELSLSRSGLADQLGISPTHVASLQAGLRKPSFRLLQRVADTFDLDGQKLFLLCYPAEARFLGQSRNSGKPGKSTWQRFAANKALLAKERVSSAELKVLKEVSQIGRVSSARQLLFVLRSIRLAFEDDWRL